MHQECTQAYKRLDFLRRNKEQISRCRLLWLETDAKIAEGLTNKLKIKQHFLKSSKACQKLQSMEGKVIKQTCLKTACSNLYSLEANMAGVSDKINKRLLISHLRWRRKKLNLLCVNNLKNKNPLKNEDKLGDQNPISCLRTLIFFQTMTFFCGKSVRYGGATAPLCPSWLCPWMQAAGR